MLARRARQMLTGAGLITGIAILIATAAPSFTTVARADALHLRLLRADPPVDSTFVGSPTELRLWFSERVNLKATSVTVTSEAGDTVKLGALSLGAAVKAPVVAKVLQKMAPGRYSVAWRAMGKDNHVVKNRYAFVLVAPNAGKGR